MNRTQTLGLILGPLVFLAILLVAPPEGLSVAGWRTAGIALWMAVWWITEPVPIPATALIPLVVMPACGVLTMEQVSGRYSREIVFLSMGGFMIAAAMERSGLHRRVALGIVARVGTSPRQLVLGFMVASAFLSMWISNTATTAMMLPIAVAVGALFKPQDTDGTFELGVCMMLGIAYAATMGGVSTLIGTPPNAILAGAASDLLDVEIGFLEWMLVGLPISLVFLPVGWWLLSVVLFPPGDLRGDAAQVLASERATLGPMSRSEWTVAVVFSLTALAWILRSEKVIGGVVVPGIVTWAPAIKDATIAMAGALALFVIPVDGRRGGFALDWNTARRIPWGVLLLFGGGLALAHAMAETGLASWIGSAVGSLDALPQWLMFAVVAALFVFLTEVTSNMATATMAMTVMCGAAPVLGVEPLGLMAIAALSSSMAFMLPVATPPNAIVFGSGELEIRQMVKAGLVLNLVAITVVTAAAILLVPTLTG